MKKSYATLGLIIISLGICSCTTTPQQQTIQKKTQAPKFNILHSIKIKKITPVSYYVWLEKHNNHQRVKAYKDYLSSQGVTMVAPDFELFRSARGWQECQYEQYDIPDQSVWANAVPTLQLLEKLVNVGILTDFELTSAYRSPILNACVGGAKESSHMQNSAVDFRIGSEFPTLFEQSNIADTKIKLCKFWQTEGPKYNMGLGVYSTGQIHIDTKGFRTWGPDHTWHSSICGEKIP